ncbi:MAG: type I methionyl aminopeptidase [Elusimicrobiota bacterium]|nr:type I methionyl aminopeptidase [Elusimicrobiota bacterium]
MSKEGYIELKSSDELETIREAAKIVSRILKTVKQEVKVGVSTKYIEEVAIREMCRYNVKSAFLGYRNFPNSICISINEELVHGIPKNNRIIKDGDIIKIDIGIKYKGFYGDIAETIPVGNVFKEAKNLLLTTYKAFENVLQVAHSGNRIGDISYSIQSFIEKNGYSVIRDYAGHGIGRNLHEKPEVPNFGQPHTGDRLLLGMVLAIEPMVALGSPEVEVLPDGWTVVTKDKKLCAHYEHMLAITENGCDVLTELDVSELNVV